MLKVPRFAVNSMMCMLCVCVVVLLPRVATACGGFFCSLVPINQAAEQIIFKQLGSDVTAVVQIQYVGEAEDFSWVVPVPGVPTFSVGSNLLFQTLEPLTRPGFNLTESGEVCLGDLPSTINLPVPSTGVPGGGTEISDVEVVSSESVGPYDVQVIRSDDPGALANWLVENNYDLSDRGAALIEPYVTAGMNFVVLKLRSGQSAGDVQPLVMNYVAEEVMIPIRLTAVAAADDMGVLVWLLGEGRAVPTNYPHVTVNYSQVDWFNGPQNAYTSYQQLVADAMDEAGGQGFATDYAGTELDVWAALSLAEQQANEQFAQLTETDNGFEYMQLATASAAGLTVSRVLEILAIHLPLPDGVDSGVYWDNEQLQQLFTDEQLAASREAVENEINDTVIVGIDNSFDVFEAPHYLTRLYTRLSAEEMTLDPTLDFNLSMESQSLVREASLVSACVDDVTQWSVTLGEGTNRAGELIMEGIGLPPTYFSTLPVEQSFVQNVDLTSAETEAESITQNSFETLKYFSTASGIEVDSSVTEERLSFKRSGGGGIGFGLLGLLSLVFVLRVWRAVVIPAHLRHSREGGNPCQLRTR